MHLPNEYINDTTSIAAAAVSATAIAWSAKSVLKNKIEEKSAAALGLATSLVFIAQMFNFPIMQGVSGHLIGGALLGAFFGPARAILAMTLVTLFQSILLGDGGLAALGANTLNLAIIPAFLGSWGSKLSNRLELKTLGVSLGAFLATIIGAISASVMIATSTSVTLAASLQAMTTPHMIAGLYEAGISLLVFGAICLLTPNKATALAKIRK